MSEVQWNALLYGFADANIYQTWAYGAVRWGERQLSHLVLRRGPAVVAAAQVRVVQVPLVRIGMAYVRWGPMCTMIGRDWEPDTFLAAVDALVAEYVGRRGLTLRLLPYLFEHERGGATARAAFQQRAAAYRDGDHGAYRTIRLNLEAPLDALRKQLAHKWRNQLNAAERNGLEVAEGTEASLFAEFVTLYRQMMARKRFDTTVNVSEFERMQGRLPPLQRMLTLVARSEGRAVSGLVAWAVGATGIYLLGATGDEGMKAKGAYLLQWHLVRRLKEQGGRWYDLGGINPAANPGVYHFKQGLGGAEVLQIGQYDFHRDRWGRMAVEAGERLRALAGRLRAGAR